MIENIHCPLCGEDFQEARECCPNCKISTTEVKFAIKLQIARTAIRDAIRSGQVQPAMCAQLESGLNRFRKYERQNIDGISFDRGDNLPNLPCSDHRRKSDASR